jgi:hypothetical protein
MRTPDEQWDEMAGEVAYALAFDLHTSLQYFDEDVVLMPVDARDDDPTKVDIRKRFLRVFNSERDFVRRVWGAVTPLLGDRQVVVLFDIDQTLGSRKGRPGESATLVRPSAAPLMRELAESGVTMGILTTRGITELCDNLDDTLHLRRIAPYIDVAHLTAAEMAEHADVTVTTTSADVAPLVFGRFRRLLRQPYDDVESFGALRDARGRPLPPKDLNKLLQLAVIREDHKEPTFVVIDDRDYADLLAGPEARVVGVHLAEHERAHY